MSLEPNSASGGTELHLETYTNPSEQVNIPKQVDVRLPWSSLLYTQMHIRRLNIKYNFFFVEYELVLVYVFKMFLCLFLIVEGVNYRNILDKAVHADQVVKERYNTHCEMIALLCKPESELCSAIPSANPAKTLQGSEVNDTLLADANK